MAKNHIFIPQSIDADDEDTDICPVCDGQCTCQKQQRQQPPLPSLKIKLTVPHSLIAKHRLVSSANAVQTTSDSEKGGYLPRKRGRPPKTNLTPSRSRVPSAFDYKSRQSSRVGATKIKQNIKARAALVKRVALRKKNSKSRNKIDSDDEDDEDSSPTDVDMDHTYHASHFPTFVSASVINNEWVIRSRKMSASSSDAEGRADMDVDDSDSDEADDGLQEPGDEDDHACSETTTTPLMPFRETQDSETTDNLSTVDPHHRQQRRRHYVRLGKAGWSFSSSEDEESTFDAQLFFRHLYDSSSSSSSSSVDGEEELTEAQDNDDEPLSSTFLCPPSVESLPFELAESWDGGVVFTNGEGFESGDIPVGFVEVERSGRGGFGFRGRGESDREIDMGMDIGVAGCASCLEDGYLEEDEECEGDEDGFSFNEANDDDEGEIEGSHSEDEEEEAGSGNTTDEDLVGSDSLPNERAMNLFKLPLPAWGSVSAVDPLSLVSARPRRELEMMEVVEGVGEKRRRGKGKNKGKGRMRRETREKGGRERRKEAKKRREMLPSPSDILEGRGTFWDERMDVSGADEESSSSSGSFDSGQALRSPRTLTPTPARSPTTPVPLTPALSTTTSFTTGPRKGVFVVPAVVSEWTKTGKRKGKAREKAMVIIGEDTNGEEVPSPHPRKRSGSNIGGDGKVEQLLRRHLAETLGAASMANIGDAMEALPPPTPLGGPFSPITDDVFSLSSPTMRSIQLADVLDPEFLKDDDTEEESAEDWSNVKGEGENDGLDGTAETVMSTESTTTPTAPSIDSCQNRGVQPAATPTPSLIRSDTDLAADAAAVKNLSRWDAISVGAFRQTQQQVRREGAEGAHHHVGGHGNEQLAHRHVRTPGSSTDYGNAMKKSGKFALGLLWRGSGGGTGSGGKAAKVAVPGAMRRTPSGGMIGSKQAKKRRLMMNSSSTSVMKQPLVLPATSIGFASGSNAASSSTTTTAASHVNTNNSPNVHGKTRKEVRRERKLQKRQNSPYNPHPSSLHPHSHQHHHQHIHHTHYHHPNSKPGRVGSAQRLGGWLIGGGSGNGGGGSGGWSGAGTSSASSGFGGGFGGLSF